MSKNFERVQRYRIFPACVDKKTSKKWNTSQCLCDCLSLNVFISVVKTFAHLFLYSGSALSVFPWKSLFVEEASDPFGYICLLATFFNSPTDVTAN